MVSLRPPSTLPVVGVLVDGRTYRHLLYLLLAIPLGFIYSALFSFGFVFGVVLSVVLVGLVVLAATLLVARLAAGFERRLANLLLGTDLDPYDDVPADAGGALGGIRKYVDAASTWRGVGFLSLKFFVTVVAFVPLFALANGLPLVLAPLRYPYAVEFGESNGEPVTWAIETLPEAMLAVPVGIAGVLVALHVTNLVAYVCRRMALALLGTPAADEANGTEGTDKTDETDETDETEETEGTDETDETAETAEMAETAETAEMAEITETTGADGFVSAEVVDPKSDGNSVSDGADH